MSTPQAPERENSQRFMVGVQGLIAANVAIYYLQLVGIFGTLEKTFGFTLNDFPARWWTAITFMFVHGGFWHLVANMYALYLFGPRLEQAWGSRRFMRFYAFCALAGLLAHAALVRDGSTLFGSSAPVFGVMIAYAITWPTDEMFVLGVIPMRAWTTVWTMIGLNLGTGIYLADGAGLRFDYFAHLAGAIGGWAFMRTPGAPSLEQIRQRVSRVPDAEEPPRPIPRSQPRGRERDDTDEIVQRSRAMMARQAAAPRVSGAKASGTTREELNRVLDKISAQGIESLTLEERRTLEDMARLLRDT
jgi:membrane associated rhomboid family serine protease